MVSSSNDKGCHRTTFLLCLLPPSQAGCSWGLFLSSPSGIFLRAFSSLTCGAPRDRCSPGHNGQLFMPNRIRTAPTPPGESGKVCGRGLVFASCGRGLVSAWKERKVARGTAHLAGRARAVACDKAPRHWPQWLGDRRFYSYTCARGWVGGVLPKSLQTKEKNLTEILEANGGGCDFLVTPVSQECRAD